MSERLDKTGRKLGRDRFGAVVCALLIILGVIAPYEAQAYVGPGAGITVIGTALAFMAGLLFAIVGFVWYPIKKLRRKRQVKRLEEVPKS